MRILLVEDERRLADFLVKGLGELGHLVDVASDGVEGKRLALGGDYDLLILDVMLPGIDGLTLLETVRRAPDDRAHIPILMLTARDEIQDRVRGLEAGADDYLVKPFAVSELFARIGALSRRVVVKGASHSTPTLRLADLEVDLIARRATRGGARLDLTGKEFSLLVALLRRRGHILTRTALAEQVWDMQFDSHTNVVEVAIRRLRVKLDDPFEPKLLHTERGMGYVMEDRTT